MMRVVPLDPHFALESPRPSPSCRVGQFDLLTQPVSLGHTCVNDPLGSPSSTGTQRCPSNDRRLSEPSSHESIHAHVTRAASERNTVASCSCPSPADFASVESIAELISAAACSLSSSNRSPSAGSEVLLTPAGPNQTKISLRVDYRRNLDPVWYFHPLQQFAMSEMAAFFIDEVLIRESRGE